MPIVFPDIDTLEAYVDQYIIANGNQEITGPINNNALNGCIEFIRQSPLNWAKASYESSGGDIVASTPVVVFNGAVPDSLTWTDNIYHEFVFINMLTSPIPLAGSLVYYTLTGAVATEIPANSAVTLFLVSNDLWVQGNGGSGGGGGSVQKQPQLYIVGVDSEAPIAGAFTWSRPEFTNSYVVLFLNRAVVDLKDAGDGSPYTTKPLGSNTLTISNYPTGWVDGDKLQFILITP